VLPICEVVSWYSWPTLKWKERSIIASHGGQLAAANAQGGGANVHFSLPSSAEGQGGRKESRQSEEGREA
jgi:hypothetical protein